MKRGLILLWYSVQPKPKDNSGNNYNFDHFFISIVTTHGLLQHCSSECSSLPWGLCKTWAKIANNQPNLKRPFRVNYIKKIQTWKWTNSCWMGRWYIKYFIYIISDSLMDIQDEDNVSSEPQSLLSFLTTFSQSFSVSLHSALFNQEELSAFYVQQH